MYVEVSVWKHTFKTSIGVYDVESADIDANTVWNKFSAEKEIKESYTEHSMTDSGKTTLVKVTF